MHNKHAEEAERICRRSIPDTHPAFDELVQSVALSLHSAVKKEREEFAEAVRGYLFPELIIPDGLETATDILNWEYWKNQEKRNRQRALDIALEVISRIQSDREKGE